MNAVVANNIFAPPDKAILSSNAACGPPTRMSVGAFNSPLLYVPNSETPWVAVKNSPKKNRAQQAQRLWFWRKNFRWRNLAQRTGWYTRPGKKVPDVGGLSHSTFWKTPSVKRHKKKSFTSKWIRCTLCGEICPKKGSVRRRCKRCQALRVAAHRPKSANCFWCGCYIENNAVIMDHIVPMALGGKDTPENIVPACFRCNASKGRKKAEVWLGLREPDESSVRRKAGWPVQK